MPRALQEWQCEDRVVVYHDGYLWGLLEHVIGLWETYCIENQYYWNWDRIETQSVTIPFINTGEVTTGKYRAFNLTIKKGSKPRTRAKATNVGGMLILRLIERVFKHRTRESLLADLPQICHDLRIDGYKPEWSIFDQKDI